MYGHADETESTATIHAALEAGITLLDTGDFYGQGHNEMLIGRALKGHTRDAALLSVKFGAMRGPDGSWIGFDARPAAMKNFLAYSLKRLRRRSHRYLPPGAPRPARAYRRHRRRDCGHGEGRLRPLHRPFRSRPRYHSPRPQGASHLPILQIEYSPSSAADPKPKSFRSSRELGIGVTAYGVLSRGLLSGSKPVRSVATSAATFPRFAGENFTQSGAGEDSADLAAEKGITAVPAGHRLGAQGRELRLFPSSARAPANN